LTAGGNSDDGVGPRTHPWLWSLLLPSTAPRAWLSAALASVFLACEVVLVILLKRVDPRDPIGAVFVGLLVLALLANFGAGVVAARRALVVIHASRDRLGELAEQQAALRTVATLVARGAKPAEVFDAVVVEMRRCLHVASARLYRFETGSQVTLVAAAAAAPILPDPHVGERVTIGADNLTAKVLATGRPARRDTGEFAGGRLGEWIRAIGIRGGVGVPVVVGGRIWGVATVGTARPGAMPADTEARMGEFTELVATAISNAATSAELQASRDDLTGLATQQAALRRVATLVARGVSPEQVFSAVAAEMARCFNVNNAQVLRFERDGAEIVVVGSYSAPGQRHIALGERLTIEGDNVSAMVLRTGQAARLDNCDGDGTIAARVRELGVRSRVGAPIVVDEHVWGVSVISSSDPEPLPTDSEERIAEFADLAATAIAAATARAALIASRVRLVAAADEARRRIERDLHDGAQQRLISLALKLRLAQNLVPAERDDLKTELSNLVSGLSSVSTELREISHGIHPAIISRGGLAPALKGLARRSTVPVSLEVAIAPQLPETVEVAAYYVVAEALTNVAKHAQASEVNVRAQTTDADLHLSIADDGIGGADFGKGSGLIGLKDRVEALGGGMHVTSSPGNGTALAITIPLRSP
jgi:signal transduction histidine kinase